jgi:hypothetical protein
MPDRRVHSIGMRTAHTAIALIVLAATLSGCSVTPAERDAITDAWAARGRERAVECRRHGVGYAAGGCVVGGP